MNALLIHFISSSLFARQIEKPKVNDGSAHPPAKKKKKKGKHNNYQELAVDSHILNPQGGKDTTVAALKGKGGW